MRRMSVGDGIASAGEPTGRARALVAFSSRDFRLLWSGQAVSMVGDAAFLVAIGWLTYSLSGSGALGVVLMLQAVGLILTLLVGGALADRISRRKLMVVSDLARAVVVAGLVVVQATGHTTVAVLGAVALVMGLGSGFFMPAFGGIVPLVVEQQHLSSANALIGVSRQLSLVVGPALAGLLYDPLGPAAVFALDSASYVFAAALVWLARPRPYEREERQGALREVAVGIRYVASVPWLWVTISLFSVFLMVVIAPVQVLLPELVAEHFDRGVGAYGLVFAAQGAGMVLGALAFAQLAPTRHRGVLSYALWTVTAAGIVLFVLSPWFVLAGDRRRAGRRARLRDSRVGDDADVPRPRGAAEPGDQRRLPRLDRPDADRAGGRGRGVRAGEPGGAARRRRRGVHGDVRRVPARAMAARGPVRWGNPWFPHHVSGCPDLNWGPLRPERSALPGCATPRAAERYLLRHQHDTTRRAG